MEIVFDESDELLWSPGLEEERQSRILHKVSTVCVEIYKFFRSLFN